MTDETQTSEAAERRKRLITLGEVIALAGLVISGLALWNSWRGDKPAVVVEQSKTIPLSLRGKVEDGGKALRLVPAENAHAIDDLGITAVAPASGSTSFGSDPVLTASTVEGWLPRDGARDGTGTMTVAVETHYVEAGESHTAKQRYRIAYHWTDGGLFGGKSLRLTSISRI